MQEYFAAQFIYLDSKELQNTILERILINPEIQKFQNILDLYYDIDYKTFRNIFIYDVLKEFKIHCDSILSLPGVNKSHLIQRCESTFISKQIIFKAGKYDSHKVDQMLVELGKTHGLSVNNVQGVIKDDIGDFYCFEYLNTKRWVVLVILYNKKSSITKRQIYNQIGREYFENLRFNLTNPYSPILVDSDPKNVVNDAKYFSEVNAILRATAFSQIGISYNDALEFLDSMLKEISQESSHNNSLLDGL